MRIIICAMPSEALAVRLALRRRFSDHGEGALKLGPCAATRHVIGDEEIRVVESGIGKVHAAAATSLICSNWAPSLLMMVGVCGGLAGRLGRLETLLARVARQSDYGLCRDEGFVSHQPGSDPSGTQGDCPGYAVSPDFERWMQAVVARCPEQPATRLGTIVSGDSFIASAAETERLRTQLDADGVDMESAAMAQVAQAFGCLWAVVRTASDDADGQASETFAALEGRAAAVAAERALISLFDVQVPL